MVTSDGVAKIVDFGLAKLTGRTMLTKAGSTLGTAAYMSPEQARGESPDSENRYLVTRGHVLRDAHGEETIR